MKNSIKYIISILAVLFMFSCTIEETLTHTDKTQFKSKIYTISPSAWQGSNNTLKYAEVKIPELTADVVEYGAVLVSIHPIDKDENEIKNIWEPLSYTWPNSVNNTDNITQWNERLMIFTYEKGAVYIEAKSPNGSNALNFDKSIEVKVDIIANKELN